ncbi:hypothetical protein LUZ60_001248 [Juncus effusus]|nr:hypothetical protein LUZ60_001248 [Juncus effusus]
MDPDQEILFEMPHVIRQYKSGRVERFFTQDVPASTDPATNVTSKDVIINQSTGLWVRIYLPNLTQPNQKLPIVVYYHGGAFMIGSASDPFSHSYMNKLTSDAKIIAVSVNYRLAPEFPFPIGYDDSLEALKWVTSHANGGSDSEPWLVQHGDFSRVFLIGCSAGANIAHTVALRAGSETFPAGVIIKGMVLIHAYFAGKERIGSELKLSPAERAITEQIWDFVCPGTTGLDDPLSNPFAEGAPSVKDLACKRVLVSVAELDPLRDRGVWYYEKLKESEWEGEAELHESEGETHAFHVFKLGSEKGAELQKRTIEFLNK